MMNTSPSINGLGILSACGRGIDALRTALQTGWVPPAFVTVANGADHFKLPVYTLPPGTLDDKSLGRKVRRADRLSKMAVFAAADALLDAKLPPELDRSRIGLIVTSAFGSHGITFQFLDEILTYGDSGVSPTIFSHSVQNAAAAYITSTLDIRGPVLTLTQIHFGFHHALILAQRWLETGQCDHVLVGSMDELGTVMHAICGAFLKPASDGKLRPFDFAKAPVSSVGEGSAFFVLSATPVSGSYGSVQQVGIGPWTAPALPPDLHILEADGILPDESGYAIPAASGGRLAAYSPLFGSMTSGTSLQMAVAALMLKEQVGYGSPVPKSPHSLLVHSKTSFMRLETIHLTRLNCTDASGRIHLSNS